MLLCIDIGNSSIGFGIFLKPYVERLSTVRKFPVYPPESVSVYKEMLKDFINGSSRGSLENFQQVAVIISSVVDDITPLIVEALDSFGTEKPIFVNHKATGDLSLNVRNKKGIGADRISNAVGAYFLLNRPLVVVDCGTATTLTVVGKNANILGGAILPGIGLMKNALFTGTDKLPDISIKTPTRFLGRDTVSAITSGIVHGTAGAVKGIIHGIEGELSQRLKIILTGGFAKILSPVLKLSHILRPNLIFDGMRVIYLKQKGFIK